LTEITISSHINIGKFRKVYEQILESVLLPVKFTCFKRAFRCKIMDGIDFQVPSTQIQTFLTKICKINESVYNYNYNFQSVIAVKRVNYLTRKFYRLLQYKDIMLLNLHHNQIQKGFSPRMFLDLIVQNLTVICLHSKSNVSNGNR